MMRYFLGLLFIFTSSLSYSAPDIVGRYRCTGQDFLNQTTFDEPTTVKKTGDTFLFTWRNKAIDFYGTAILIDKTLSVVFWTPFDPLHHGVVSYQVMPKGDLKGKWAVKNGTITGDEYCQRLKS